MSVLWFAGSLFAEEEAPLATAGPAPKEIVFAVRKPGQDGHWYANFGYYGPDENRVAYLPGGRLCKLDLATGKVVVLIDDPEGGVRDPVVNHDATRIIFSWRKGGGRFHHLYECGLDGANLRQLTDGPWDDIEPCILPEGDIVFVSTRCKRWVNCWLTQVATLHRCKADGSGIHPISANIEHDNTPWPLPDGRILFQRWEYIDRSQVSFHHLWTANPDGTNPMPYFGNQSPGTLIIDAKPIPGTDEVVALFSPGHGQKEHAGRIVVLHPQLGPDDARAARVILGDSSMRDPWPFSRDDFLAARRGEILSIDAKGKTKKVHSLSAGDIKAGYWIHEPRPVLARPREAVIPTRTDPSKPTGKLILGNILEGRNMAGVAPGEIRKLLILESLPKPINYTGGMDPLTYGGSFTLERVVGTVPVERDGSAYFELPAQRSFLFVALDEKDLAVKRMRSFVSVQPGETTSCVGCHEQRTNTMLPPDALMALSRPASIIAPEPGVPEVFDFPRDIQPILDKACVDCHGYEKTPRGGPYAGKLILTGDRGPMFSHSYFMLTVARLFSDGRNKAEGNSPPRSLGSSASRLLKFVDGSHYGASITPEELRTLRLWIDAAATYPGTYAALGTGSIGGYVENRQTNTDKDWPTTLAGADVMKQRCLSCHGGSGASPLPLSLSDERGHSFWQPRIPDATQVTSRHLVFNLTRPEKSLLLLAPLAREGGGYQLCRASGAATPVFPSTVDPGYQTLLAMVNAGKRNLETITRFDMPDFKPHPAYLREMKRYGILPPSAEAGTFDPYAADRKYWESLWHSR